MSHDDLLRAGAVAVAVALIAAPYWQTIRGRLAEAAAAAKVHGPLIARVAAAALVIAAAWGRIPLPAVPQPVAPVSVETPTVEMQAAVRPVARALAGLPMGDRMLWAQTWNKAALVVQAEGVGETTVFTETPALRIYTVLVLDIAWRRIGDHAPGSVPGLRDAVEAVLAGVLGTKAVPVTPDIRARYCEVARAIAWAGVNGG